MEHYIPKVMLIVDRVCLSTGKWEEGEEGNR